MRLAGGVSGLLPGTLALYSGEASPPTIVTIPVLFPGNRFATRLFLRENGNMILSFLMPVNRRSPGSPGDIFSLCRSGTEAWTFPLKHHRKYIFHLLSGTFLLFFALIFLSPQHSPLPHSPEELAISLPQILSVSSGPEIAPGTSDRIANPSARAESMLDCRHLDLAGVTSWICNHPKLLHSLHSGLSSSELPGIFRLFSGPPSGYITRYSANHKRATVLVLPPPPKPDLHIRFMPEPY